MNQVNMNETFEEYLIRDDHEREDYGAGWVVWYYQQKKIDYLKKELADAKKK